MAGNLKIALLELCGIHDECLYSQVRFIKEHGEHSLHLFATKRIQNRVADFDLLDSSFFFPNEKLKIGQLWWLRNHLIREGFDKVILNSASGNNVRNFLLLPYPKKPEFLGTIHNISKLKDNFAQRLISRRIKKYFVLNDYLLQGEQKHSMGAFYPIFFPALDIPDCAKGADDIWVTIPGRIEARRRDYELLFQTLEARPVDKKTKFILLGGGSEKHGVGREVREKIESLGLTEQFVMWDDFVPLPTFHGYLSKSDYIMPLVRLNDDEGLQYHQQITGAFNLAFSYKIPFLMDSYFENFADFKANSIFYKRDTLADVLVSLEKPEREQYYQESKWSFQEQKKRYWELLLRA